MPETAECKICRHSGPHSIFRAREMMFGTRAQFKYFECAGCGTVQIAEIPANLACYYPEDYYSLNAVKKPEVRGLRLLLKKIRADYLLTGRGLLGGMLVKKFGYWERYDWLRAAGVQRNEAILDIGCGSGETLLRLRDDGFGHLTGADPFISAPLEYPGCGREPVKILKCAAPELTGLYDVVLMDHSFEHVPNPAEVLAAVARLLRPGGRAIIGIPVAAWAWRHYRADWVQLDPPRHLFLFSVQSFGRLAKEAGLQVSRTVFDSGAFQFTGSELYRRDIPLTRVAPDGTRAFIDGADYFSAEELRDYSARAKQLNASGDGDRACFVLARN